MLQVFSRSLEPINYGLWRPLLRQLDEMLEGQATPRSSAVEPWIEEDRAGFAPHYDMHETDSHYLLCFDIPGVPRDDLNIELSGNRLVVSGERKTEARAARGRYGKFYQVFTLPDGVTAEGLVAEHKDGVLSLSITKPSAAKLTKIKIADGAGKPGLFRNLIGEKKVKGLSEAKVPEDNIASAVGHN